MNRSVIIRRLLPTPSRSRTSILPNRTTPGSASRRYATVQGVTQTSFWLNLIPKPLRKRSIASGAGKKPRSRKWNPATFYIFIFLFIGSMAIQMIALRNNFAAFSRRADAKIGLLKEIIEKIQKGEEVDVEGLLGVGDKDKEKEWEEVLQEIQREHETWEQSRRNKPKHRANLDKEAASANPPNATKVVEANRRDMKPRTRSNAPPGFY